MADLKYGRLFTERDVLAILDEATMGVPEGFEEGSLNRILAMLIERAEADKAPMTFPADEPLFLLRGQDRAAPSTVGEYTKRCRECGAPPEHVSAAIDVAIVMRDWQAANPDRVKVPD